MNANIPQCTQEIQASEIKSLKEPQGEELSIRTVLLSVESVELEEPPHLLRRQLPRPQKANQRHRKLSPLAAIFLNLFFFFFPVIDRDDAVPEQRVDAILWVVVE